MRPTRKTKMKCNVCHQYIRIKYNNAKYSYYTCDDCNITYVKDRNLDKIVRAYEPRTTIKF